MRSCGPSILALAALVGCYGGHGATVDAGGAEPDAGAPVPCAIEGARCDDGNPCTRTDRCRAGVCEGQPLRCTDPPLCHALIGACVDGACRYEPLTGPACDDGDACTDDDACEAGACVGAPRVCDAPRPAACLNATFLRESLAPGACDRGDCVYPTFERPCPDGCVDGACECVPEGWGAETIDQDGDVGRYTAVEADRAGGVHVAYYVAPLEGDLRYAYRAPSGAWTTEDVETAGDVGGSPSLAIDRDGRPHVVYDDLTANGLRYARQRPDGAWVAEAVDPGAASWGGAIALGPGGEVHVAYTFETAALETRLRYARRLRDGTWERQTVDDGSAAGLYPSVALDAAGAVHVVHFDPERRALRHALLAPGATELLSEVIDDSGQVEGGNALAADRTGGVHVGYFRGGGDRLIVASRDREGRWSGAPVPGTSGARWNVGIGVDASGALHVLFDSDQPDLFVANRRPGAPWTVERVASTGFTLSFQGGASLDVGPRGDVHVSHYDERGRSLMYARRRPCF